MDRLLIAGRQLLTVSSRGKYLRSWSMRDGSLLWELVTYTAAAPSADAKAERDKDRGVDVLPLGVDVDGDGDEDLLTLSRGDVALRSLVEGVAAWSAEAAAAFDETVRLHRVARNPATGKLIAFGVTEDDGAPAAIEMDPKTGEVTRKAVAGGNNVGLSDCPRGTTLAVGADGNVFASGVTADGAKTYAVDVAKLLSGKTRGAVSFAPVPERIGAVGRARPVRGADAPSDASPPAPARASSWAPPAAPRSRVHERRYAGVRQDLASRAGGTRVLGGGFVGVFLRRGRRRGRRHHRR